MLAQFLDTTGTILATWEKDEITNDMALAFAANIADDAGNPPATITVDDVLVVAPVVSQ